MDPVDNGSNSRDPRMAGEVNMNDVDQAIVAPEVPVVSESDNTPLAYPDLLNVQSNNSNLTSSTTSSMQDIDRQPMMRVGLSQPSNGTQPSLNRPNVVHDHQSSTASSSTLNSNPQRPSRAVGPSVSASSGAIPKIGMNRQRPGGPPDVSVVNPSTSRDVTGNGDGAFGSPSTARSSVTVEPYVVRNSRSPESDRVDRIEQEILSLQTSRTSFERRVCQTIETIPNQMAAIVSSVQRLQSNIESMVSTVNERMSQLEIRLNNLTISTEATNPLSDAASSSSSGRITVMDPSVALIREELRNFTRNQRRDMAAERAGYLMAISEALKAVAGVDTENVDTLNHRGGEEEEDDLHGHHHHLHPSSQMNGPSSSGL